MLSRLINSYLKLNIPDNVTISLEVVENDTASHSKKLVESIASDTLHPVLYHYEPLLGIPFARNRCIDIALNKNADFLAFVDDDEWFTKNWLTEIWSYSQTQPTGTVIQGNVLSQLPDNTPSYFYPFFQRKEVATGSPLHMCKTNNVLVPISVFKEHKLSFDESKPFAGGTDSKLFRLAHSRGVHLVYCAEAIVNEEVPIERLNYRWLSKRYFRIGLTMGEHMMFRGRLDQLTHTTSRTLSCIKYSLKAAIYLVLAKKEKQLRSWLKACKKLGEGLGPWGFSVDSYRRVEGS